MKIDSDRYAKLLEENERLTAALAAAEVTAWNAAIEAAADKSASSFLFDGIVNKPQDSYAQCRARAATTIAQAIRALRKETP